MCLSVYVRWLFKLQKRNVSVLGGVLKKMLSRVCSNYPSRTRAPLCKLVPYNSLPYFVALQTVFIVTILDSPSCRTNSKMVVIE